MMALCHYWCHCHLAMMAGMVCKAHQFCCMQSRLKVSQKFLMTQELCLPLACMLRE